MLNAITQTHTQKNNCQTHKWKIEHENVLIRISEATSTIHSDLVEYFPERNENDNVDEHIEHVSCKWINGNHFELKIK